MNQFCHASEKVFSSSLQIEVYSQISERKYFSINKRQNETLKPLILFSGTNQCTWQHLKRSSCYGLLQVSCQWCPSSWRVSDFTELPLFIPRSVRLSVCLFPCSLVRSSVPPFPLSSVPSISRSFVPLLPGSFISSFFRSFAPSFLLPSFDCWLIHHVGLTFEFSYVHNI